MEKNDGSVYMIPAFFVGMLLGGLLGQVSGCQAERKQALKAGVAYWEVDSLGETSFKYGTKEKK